MASQAERTDQPNAGSVNLSPYHALIVGPPALAGSRQPEPSPGVPPMIAMVVCNALWAIVASSRMTADGKTAAESMGDPKPDGKEKERGNAFMANHGDGADSTYQDNLFAIS